MHSVRDNNFKQALVESSLNTADGIGIIWASKYLAQIQKLKVKSQKIGGRFATISNIKYRISKIFWLKVTLAAILFNKKWLASEIPERVTGIDLMWELANRAQERNWKIYLLAWDKGRTRAEEVEEKLKMLYPRINIVGIHDGYPEAEGIVEEIAKTKPDLLFVAFGSPKQEVFIHKNLKNFHCKVVIGVGGSFDFIAGHAKRAPKIFRATGLEWLYRFAKQPKRVGRIFNAFPRFVWKVFLSK